MEFIFISAYARAISQNKISQHFINPIVPKSYYQQTDRYQGDQGDSQID
jgi:hypothetical protein